MHDAGEEYWSMFPFLVESTERIGSGCVCAQVSAIGVAEVSPLWLGRTTESQSPVI